MRETDKYKNLPYNHELRKHAKELRKAGNLSEVLIWQQLKNKQFKGYDFDRQKIIGNYIVDFFCIDKGVVIEIDGFTHEMEKDAKRDKYLESLGLKVIRIMDEDVKKKFDRVMEYLNTHSYLE